MEFAEKLALLTAMHETVAAYKKNKLDSLIPEKDGKLIVTTGQIEDKSLSRLLDKSALLVLMSRTRTAFLCLMRAHCGEAALVHRSAVVMLSILRAFVWIVREKQLAKTIVKNCLKCAKVTQEPVMQQITKLKSENVVFMSLS